MKRSLQKAKYYYKYSFISTMQTKIIYEKYTIQLNKIKSNN